jgi:hypothetical protein
VWPGAAAIFLGHAGVVTRHILLTLGFAQCCCCRLCICCLSRCGQVPCTSWSTPRCICCCHLPVSCWRGDLPHTTDAWICAMLLLPLVRCGQVPRTTQTSHPSTTGMTLCICCPSRCGQVPCTSWSIPRCICCCHLAVSCWLGDMPHTTDAWICAMLLLLLCQVWPGATHYPDLKQEA